MKQPSIVKISQLKKRSKEPSQYKIVIIGVHIWYYTKATPIRTFLHQQKDLFSRVAFFCMYDGTGMERTFADT